MYIQAETRVAAPLQGDLMSGTNCSLNRTDFSFLLAGLFSNAAGATRASSFERGEAWRRSEETFTVVMRFAR